jgi:hypothetical protein
MKKTRGRKPHDTAPLNMVLLQNIYMCTEFRDTKFVKFRTSVHIELNFADR